MFHISAIHTVKLTKITCRNVYTPTNECNIHIHKLIQKYYIHTIEIQTHTHKLSTFRTFGSKVDTHTYMVGLVDFYISHVQIQIFHGESFS